MSNKSECSCRPPIKNTSPAIASAIPSKLQPIYPTMQQTDGSMPTPCLFQVHENSLANLIATAVRLISGDMPKPSVFTGDPLEFPDWSVAFNGLVDKKLCSQLEKIHLLRKYVVLLLRQSVVSSCCNLLMLIKRLRLD